jgi:predicted nucleotidyltransferase
VNHILIFSLAHSIITITVSIAIQRVKTNEKLVKKFIDDHIVSSTINVIINASGIKSDAINHSLNHTKNRIVKNTKIIVVRAVVQRLS